MSTGPATTSLSKRSPIPSVYDAENNALVYLAHARELQLGSGKMSLSVIPLAKEQVTWTRGAPSAQ